jgi:hypothetical protein
MAPRPIAADPPERLDRGHADRGLGVLAQGVREEVERPLAAGAGERVQGLHAQLGVGVAERPRAQETARAGALEPDQRGDRAAAHQRVVLRGEHAREDVEGGLRRERADLRDR